MADVQTIKRRGRKPIDANDSSVRVTITITATHFADLRERAQRDLVSVPEQIRRDLRDVDADRNPLIVK